MKHGYPPFPEARQAEYFRITEKGLRSAWKEDTPNGVQTAKRWKKKYRDGKSSVPGRQPANGVNVSKHERYWLDLIISIRYVLRSSTDLTPMKRHLKSTAKDDLRTLRDWLFMMTGDEELTESYKTALEQ